MTTKKRENEQGPSNSLDESLFDDLDLNLTEQAATPATPLTSLIDDNGKRRPNTPYPPHKTPTQSRAKMTTSALRIPPPPKSKVLFLLVVLLMISGGIGLAHYMGYITLPYIEGTTPPVAESYTVLVRSTPKGATIRIDTKKYEKTTPFEIKLSKVKIYTIELTKEGCQPHLGKITITKSQQSTYYDGKLDCKQQKSVANTRKAPNKGRTPPERRGTKQPLTPPRPQVPDQQPKSFGIGYVQLDCKPKNAKVSIGTELTGIVCGGTKKFPLPSKSYEVLVKKPGYFTHKGTIQIQAKQILPLKIKLKRKRKKIRKRRVPTGSAKVMFRSTPKASIFWEGRQLGQTPLEHDFPAQRRVRVVLKTNFGSRKTLSFRLQPKTQVTKKVRFSKGTIKFIILPWADVYINGKKIGQTPIKPVKKPEGVYRIELRMNKLRKRSTIRLYAGQTYRFKHTFQRK